MKEEDLVIQKIQILFQEKGPLKKILGAFLGYGGSGVDQAFMVTKILTQQIDLSVEHINKIANFYRYPVGYFLLGNEDSWIQQIDEKEVIEYIKILFKKEGEKPKSERKAKYKLGALIGYGSEKTSQINHCQSLSLL